MLTKKLRFFGARSPSKLVYIGAKDAFRKILGSVGQKWISEKVSKGGPFGSAGGRIPEGGGRPPPTLNPPLLYDNIKLVFKWKFESGEKPLLFGKQLQWARKVSIVFLQNKKTIKLEESLLTRIMF